MQVRGGITFRVGHADETFLTRGMTHLVEHLAMHALGERLHPNNAFVDSTTTTFHATGTPSEVAAFLTDVCRALGQLAADRLETERRVLRSEAADRSGSLIGQLLLWRFGLRGFGLADSREWALENVTIDDVRSWSARYFTAANSVAWFSSAPPDGLRIELPPGAPLAAPDAVEIVATPGHFDGPADGIAVSFLGDRSSASAVAAGMLGRRLQTQLRLDKGLLYDVNGNYLRLTETVSHISYSGGLLRDVASKAAVEFAAAVSTAVRLEPTDLRAYVEVASRALEPQEMVGRIPEEARNLLLGAPYSLVEWRRDLEHMSVEDVVAATAQLVSTAMWMIPPGSQPPAGSVEIPMSSAGPVKGRRYRPVWSTKTAPRRVVVGHTGITVVQRSGIPLTVRWDEAVGCLAWPGGRRSVVGQDGISLTIDPDTMGTRGVTRSIDRRIDQGLVLSLDEPRRERAFWRHRRGSWIFVVGTLPVGRVVIATHHAIGVALVALSVTAVGLGLHRGRRPPKN
jgi:hypothetical protein